MPAFTKFNPVNFSKNITKTISNVESKLNYVKSVPKSLTDEINAKTGLNIAAPPLPPINSNIKGLVGDVKKLVKNPSGVVKGGVSAVGASVGVNLQNVSLNSVKGLVSPSNIKGAATGFAKASFGVASAAVRANLSAVKVTLRAGIKNCLRNAISSLLSSINLPNIPFGGISGAVIAGPGGVSAVITGTVNAKLNKFLNGQITLLGRLEQKKVGLTATVNGNLNILKEVKSGNFYTAKLTAEVNKSINKMCNTLSPTNKKRLSRGGAIVDMVANSASDVIVNNLENQIVQAASGFSAKAPTDFFNSVTGLPSSTINKATGKVAIAAEKTVDAVVSQPVETIKTSATQAYNNIKDAINSNVPKLS